MVAIVACAHFEGRATAAHPRGGMPADGEGSPGTLSVTGYWECYQAAWVVNTTPVGSACVRASGDFLLVLSIAALVRVQRSIYRQLSVGGRLQRRDFERILPPTLRTTGGDVGEVLLAVRAFVMDRPVEPRLAEVGTTNGIRKIVRVRDLM